MKLLVYICKMNNTLYLPNIARANQSARDIKEVWSVNTNV